MSRTRIALAALVLVPALAHAQFGGTSAADPTRNQLRDRIPGQRGQQNKTKLDEALRNFNAPEQAKRLEGVQQLGTVEDQTKATAYLLQAANDSDSAIRLAAIDVLGQVKAKDAIGPLVQQLFMRGTDPVTMQRILVALGRIGDERATKPLVDFLARDTDRQLRGNAMFALGEIGDEDALAPLGRFAEETTDPSLRAVAQTAMRKIRERPAPEVVPSALAQEQLRNRAAAGQRATQ